MKGLPRSGDHWFHWPLGDATSMGVHGSQSLFWECLVARSEAFARRWQPRFAEDLGSDPWTRFRDWFESFDAADWDQRIQQDVQAGALDWLAEEAMGDLAAGRFSDRYQHQPLA